MSALATLEPTSIILDELNSTVENDIVEQQEDAARAAAFVRQSLAEQTINLAAEVADDHKGRLERDWDLAETVKKMPAKQQAVIILHYYQGMTLPSMAQALHISENTLKKRIQAALNNLRRVLRPEDIAQALVA
jgi:RNA polymerase sigma-70 factor, ECF subfamily